MKKRKVRVKRDAEATLATPALSTPPSLAQLIAWRLLFAVFLGGFGMLLIPTGKRAIENRSFDVAWESSEGQGGSPWKSSQRHKQHGLLEYRDSDAVEQGVGLMAGGATFEFWSLLLIWGLTSPTTLKTEWRFIYTLVFSFSLICLTAAILGLFPPWHIPFWPSCDAFYCVIAFLLFLACIRDRALILYYSQRGFPSLIMGGMLVAPIFPGALAGIVAGIFLGLALGFHLVMLIPSVRNSLMKEAGETPGESETLVSEASNP